MAKDTSLSISSENGFLQERRIQFFQEFFFSLYYKVGRNMFVRFHNIFFDIFIFSVWIVSQDILFCHITDIIDFYINSMLKKAFWHLINVNILISLSYNKK